MAAQSLHALSFQQVTFTPVSRDNQVWIRVSQIGLALGYSNPEISVTRIYNRNADEFTPAMTQLIELDTAGGRQSVRVFSLRGAHLLAMFSRTPVAKDFRRWVLDVLDRETQQHQAATTLPASTAANLHALFCAVQRTRTELADIVPALYQLRAPQAARLYSLNEHMGLTLSCLRLLQQQCQAAYER